MRCLSQHYAMNLYSTVSVVTFAAAHQRKKSTLVLSDVCKTDYAVSDIRPSLQLRICIDLAYIHILCSDAALQTHIICCVSVLSLATHSSVELIP